MIITPNWISKIFFEKALTKYFDDQNIQILEYTTKPAVGVGENYTSQLLRVSVTYTTNENGKENKISIVVKYCPNNETLVNYARSMRLFEHEISIYSEVFPALNKILDNALGNTQKLTAKCAHVIKQPQSALVFEDLTTSGFKMHPRLNGLDLQHCLLVVEKLAYLHAASIILYEKDPSIIHTFNIGLYWENEFIIKWIIIGFEALIEACANWPGYEKYSSKLKLIQNQVVERTLTAAKRKLGGWNVLNHGDAWINNIMFLYGPDGTPKDLRFVDFQSPRHSSPVIDLHYFWATSPNIEVRNKHVDTVLNHYYSKLLETFTKLQYPLEKIPSREELRKDFDSRAFYGLGSAVTVLPLVAATKRDDATLEDLFAEDQSKNGFRQDAYNNERYRKYMEYLLPFYDNLGVLEP